MAVSWYPGHMVTARKEAAVTMRTTDVVIEVLDARVPLSSCNPAVEELRRETRRPALKLLNKVDLADPKLTTQWLAYYNAQPGVRALGICAKKSGDVQKITSQCQALAPDRTTAEKPLRLMILGIPNVGKSTLMNTWLKRKVANVGDEPAITKMQMRHKLGPHTWLVDTPGLLWPGVAPEVAMRLAATHSIGRNAYDDETVALELARYLLTHHVGLLERRYGPLPAPCSGPALLLWLAESRTLKTHGGGPDVAKAALILLTEFRAGVLGRVTLEAPPQGATDPA